MKLIVCIKQVPARDSTLRLNDAQTWIREGDISYEINEPDAYALEAALRLKEQHGGEVVAISAGPARVLQVIREALAKGADRAIHLEDDAFAQLDAYNTARLLATGIKDEAYDLVLAGLQSDDLGFAQTGVILAELLGTPHATIIMDVQPAEGRVRVKRELEGGWFQTVEMPLPAVLTIQSGLARLRYATLMGIKKAKTKPVRRLTKADLGADLGADLEWQDADWGNRQSIRRVYLPRKTKQTQFLDGSPKEVAVQLAEKLKFEARVL